jgi:hypothetical protein
MIERTRTIPIDDQDLDPTSAEAVIRYLDYRSQAIERRKELDILRDQCITNSRGKTKHFGRTQVGALLCHVP